MKILTTILILILAVLQYKLWFDVDGITQSDLLKKSIQTQLTDNQGLRERNLAMTAEVDDLKHGQTAIEERARNELGMVKPGEVFYQVPPSSAHSAHTPQQTVKDSSHSH